MKKETESFSREVKKFVQEVMLPLYRSSESCLSTELRSLLRDVAMGHLLDSVRSDEQRLTRIPAMKVSGNQSTRELVSSFFTRCTCYLVSQMYSLLPDLSGDILGMV